MSAVAGGVRLAVRLTPRGRSDRIEGVAASIDRRPVLKLSVTAPPAEGRANAALIDVLAKEWRIPKRDISIVAGLKSRDKQVHITGNPVALVKQIGALIAALPVS